MPFSVSSQRHLPQQHVAGVAGGDSVKGVHAELVEVVRRVLRSDVGSKEEEGRYKFRFSRSSIERPQQFSSIFCF